MNGFGEIGRNGHFWTVFLGKKAKMSLPYAYYAATLCKKPHIAS